MEEGRMSEGRGEEGGREGEERREGRLWSGYETYKLIKLKSQK